MVAPVRAAAIAAHDCSDDELCLGMLVICGEEFNKVAVAAVSPEVFALALLVMADDGVCRAEDMACAAVVLLKADGAAVLYCLNKMYGANLSEMQLREISSKVGADIPFSLTGGTAIVLNTGDVIAPVKPLSDCKIIIVKPEQDVSTKEAYSMLDKLPRIRHLDRAGMLEAAAKGDYQGVCSRCGNVFEQAVEVPERPHIKSIMRKYGADASLMSGSGPTVFGIFSDNINAEKCFEELGKKYKNVFKCSPVNKGIIEILR